MRQLLGFLCALLVSTFTYPYTVQGTGDLLPPTPSYDHPIEIGKRTWVVTVGQVAHAFYPLTVNASIGDVIIFKFYPPTHSATLADYDGPCVPWSHAHPEQSDVWSGLITETEARQNPQSWKYRVDTLDPRFFYCSAPDSCIVSGMVFAVNPSSTQTIEHFKQGAYIANFALSPGESTPPEGSPTPSATPSPKSMSKGAIIGIVLGGIAAVALMELLFLLIHRSRKKSVTETNGVAETSTVTAPAINPTASFRRATQPHPPPEYYGQGYGEDWRAKGLATPVPPISPVNSHYNPHVSIYGSPPLGPVHPHYNSQAPIYGSPPLGPVHPHYNSHVAMYGSPPPPLSPPNPHYNPHSVMYGGPPHILGPNNPHHNPHAEIYGGPPPTNPRTSLPPQGWGGEGATQQQRVKPPTPGADGPVPPTGKSIN